MDRTSTAGPQSPAAHAMPPGGVPDARQFRGGSFIAGLLLLVLALFMLQATLQEVCVAINLGRYQRDEFELEYFSEATGEGQSSLGGHVVSTGEHFTLRTGVMRLDKLRELDREKKIAGYRTSVWYLPAQGTWRRLDRVLTFRVLAPDQFELPRGFRPAVIGINTLLIAAGVLLIRRGVYGNASAAPPDPNA